MSFIPGSKNRLRSSKESLFADSFYGYNLSSVPTGQAAPFTPTRRGGVKRYRPLNTGYNDPIPKKYIYTAGLPSSILDEDKKSAAPTVASAAVDVVIV